MVAVGSCRIREGVVMRRFHNRVEGMTRCREEGQRCLNAGTDDVVPEPTEAAQLFAVLRPFLDGLRRQER